MSKPYRPQNAMIILWKDMHAIRFYFDAAANLLGQLNYPVLCGVFISFFSFLLKFSNLRLCMYQTLYLYFRKYIPVGASLPEERKYQSNRT